ncbi:MAG: TraR/DksA family transcriptional regulator [Chitinophagales bacterium]
MDLAEREELKEKIEGMMAIVEDQIFELKVLTEPISPDNALGRVTRMDAINNKSVNEENLRRAKLKLSKLQTSISKIDDLEFGKCVKCGRPIKIARLMYMPESNNCMTCAH